MVRGSFFWWKKIDKEKLKEALTTPVIITLLVSGLIVLVSNWMQTGYFKEIPDLLLLTAGLYSIIANAQIFAGVYKSSPKLSGGAVAHMGIAMMLIGILMSSGYSKIISMNRTGLVWSNELPDEVNRNNLLLFQHQPRQMGKYELLYKGVRKQIRGYDGYVNEADLEQLPNAQLAVLKKDLLKGSEVVFKSQDTVQYKNFENSYFEIKYSSNTGKVFTLYPRIQINERMGAVMSPDIDRRWDKDLYTHVRTFPDPESETEWSDMDTTELKLGETFHVNDFTATLQDVQRITEIPGVGLSENDVAVKASIVIQGSGGQQYVAQPIYLIKNRMVGRIPDEVDDVAAKFTLLNIHPNTGSFEIGTNTTQLNWVILEAVEKPFINILWIGTLLLVIGFSIAINRRYTEFMKMRDKGVEVTVSEVEANNLPPQEIAQPVLEK